ncbi:hypothetical protein MTO98_30510 [Mucilaginibacter sp. SMC90]|uniref:hypothetical protein n=1 Tax=Mucilaginibacter sp. SMC90 TaxID=2929803 RepID=UPI001FB436FC|nr:hypothetical protein [Mucilaginibacter sp. SMC90]UOE48735.1 hypothetical protein MTO98_30510 [Mucilaginibacter sp. SMC90]
MDRATNLFELKNQLADLGFVSPQLVDRLRESVMSDNIQWQIQHREVSERVAFDFFFDLYRPERDGPVVLYGYDAALYQQNTMNESWRGFHADISKESAAQVLAKALVQQLPDEQAKPWMLNQEGVKAYLAENNPKRIDYFQQLNHSPMNQNVEFLKNSLLNLGFGEKLNGEMEKQIEAKTPEFNLTTQQEYNQRKVDYTLHFKAGNNQDMYFLNKFDASVKQGNENTTQSFYINKGNGVTAKEAFNLMDRSDGLDGRAVFKQLFNKDHEKYHAWVKLDWKDLTDGGNARLKQHSFDVEKFLDGKGIKEMNDPKSREDLLRSLKKGNKQQITVEKDGNEQKYFIAANPQYKTVNVFDHQMKKMKREELFPSAQKQETSQKQTRSEKQGDSSKAQEPEKKQSRKSSVKV